MAPPLTDKGLILHPRETQGSRATDERGDHDEHTRCVGSAMRHDRHGDGSAGEGHVAHVERSCGESREGNADDHRRACAGRLEPCPPTQRACGGLRTRGLCRDAGEGWTTGNPDTWTELL